MKNEKRIKNLTLEEIKTICDSHYPQKGGLCQDNGCPLVGTCFYLFKNVVPTLRWFPNVMNERVFKEEKRDEDNET